MKGLRSIIRESKPWTALRKDKRWLSLLACLALALFFWFLIVLDAPGRYTKEYCVGLVLPELPGRYVVTDSTGFPTELTVKVRANGGKLFRYSLRNLFFAPAPLSPDVDEEDLSPEGGVLEFDPRLLKSSLLHSASLPASTVSMLSDTIGDLSISPARIYLRYEPLDERDAEVIFSSQVDFGKSANLKLVDTVGLFPKVVRLYGPKSTLDSLEKADGSLVVYTDTTSIKIGNPGRVLLPVALLAERGTYTEPDSVFVSFTTEELVHASFMVNHIEVRGLDGRHTLKLLPPSVKVTILVPRTKADEMTYDPMLYVDASGVIGADSGYRLEVHVGNPPSKSNVDMIQLDPDRLDFILEEKIPTLRRQKLGTPDGTLR